MDDSCDNLSIEYREDINNISIIRIGTTNYPGKECLTVFDSTTIPTKLLHK